MERLRLDTRLSRRPPVDLESLDAPAPPQASRDRYLKLVGVGLLALGVLQFLWSHRGSHPSPGPARAQRIHIKVTGRLELPGGTRPEELRAQLELPQIPLILRRQGKELWAQGNDFLIDQELTVSSPPTTFAFLAEAPGKGRVEVHNLRFSQEEGVLVYDLASLKLSSAKAAPPPPPTGPPPIVRTVPTPTQALPPNLLAPHLRGKP